MKLKAILVSALFSVALVTATNVQGQWVLTDSTYGFYISRLNEIGPKLFATADAGVYLSTNDGTSWTVVDSEYGSSFYIGAVIDTNIFASDDGIYLSIDSGRTWIQRSIGLPSNFAVNAFANIGNNIFAASNSEVFISSDLGMNWNSDSTTPIFQAVAPLGTDYFAGTSNGVFRSTDSGTTWVQTDNGLVDHYLHSVVTVGNNVIAGADDGIYISTDSGSHWTATNLRPQSAMSEVCISCFAKSGTNIFAGTYFNTGVFVSRDSGNTWLPFNDSLPIGSLEVYTLLATDSFLYAGTDVEGVWRYPLSDLGSSSVSTAPPSNESISLYPIPCSTNLTIHASNIEQIKVFDLLGTLRINQQYGAGTSDPELDVSGLSAGVYSMEVTAGGMTRFIRMVKN